MARRLVDDSLPIQLNVYRNPLKLRVPHTNIGFRKVRKGWITKVTARGLQASLGALTNSNVPKNILGILGIVFVNAFIENAAKREGFKEVNERPLTIG